MNESREASVHALVGAYAIDALDDQERAGFEEHLAGCADCQAEVASLQEAAALLGGAEQLTPPAGVRGRVLAGIAGSRDPADPPRSVDHADAAAQPVTQPVTHVTAGETTADHADRDDNVVVLSRRRFRMTTFAAAAAVLAAVGAGAVVADQVGDQPTVEQAAPTLAERVQQAEDAERVPVDLGDGVRATVIRSVELNRAVVVTENMPPPPEGKVYELWLDDREKGFVPAGLMSTTSDQTLVLQGNAADATRVAVTVEPAAGSRVPTSEPIVVFPFDSAQA